MSEPYVWLGALALVSMTLTAGCRGAAGAPSRQEATTVAASSGRVEGASELVEVSAALDGVLSAVLVAEGDDVQAGDELARLACDDLAADLRAAVASAESERQAAVRLAMGSRREEKRAAAAEVAETRAVFERADDHRRRQVELFRRKLVPEQSVEEARRDAAAAEGRLRASSERRRQVDAGPLPQDMARADASASAAAGRADAAAARLAKCSVRAPFAGRVLRRHREPGEAVSAVFPTPVVTIADVSRLRIRAEVDEGDLSKVAQGQRAWVQADALGSDRLACRVSQVGAMMGRKKVRSGDAGEKADRDIREVILDVERPDERLVFGLRVTVLFSGTN